MPKGIGSVDFDFDPVTYRQPVPISTVTDRGSGGHGGGSTSRTLMQLAQQQRAQEAEQERGLQRAEMYRRQQTRDLPPDFVSGVERELGGDRKDPYFHMDVADEASRLWSTMQADEAAKMGAQLAAQKQADQTEAAANKDSLKAARKLDELNEKALRQAAEAPEKQALEDAKWTEKAARVNAENERDKLSWALAGKDPSLFIPKPGPSKPRQSQVPVPVYERGDPMAPPPSTPSRYVLRSPTEGRGFLYSDEVGQEPVAPQPMGRPAAAAPQRQGASRPTMSVQERAAAAAVIDPARQAYQQKLAEVSTKENRQVDAEVKQIERSVIGSSKQDKMAYKAGLFTDAQSFVAEHGGWAPGADQEFMKKLSLADKSYAASGGYKPVSISAVAQDGSSTAVSYGLGEAERDAVFTEAYVRRFGRDPKPEQLPSARSDTATSKQLKTLASHGGGAPRPLSQAQRPGGDLGDLPASSVVQRSQAPRRDPNKNPLTWGGAKDAPTTFELPGQPQKAPLLPAGALGAQPTTVAPMTDAAAAPTRDEQLLAYAAHLEKIYPNDPAKVEDGVRRMSALQNKQIAPPTDEGEFVAAFGKEIEWLNKPILTQEQARSFNEIAKYTPLGAITAPISGLAGAVGGAIDNPVLSRQVAGAAAEESQRGVENLVAEATPLDVASVIPGPVGAVAGAVDAGAGLSDLEDAYRAGDWAGVAANMARIFGGAADAGGIARLGRAPGSPSAPAETPRLPAQERAARVAAPVTTDMFGAGFAGAKLDDVAEWAKQRFGMTKSEPRPDRVKGVTEGIKPDVEDQPFGSLVGLPEREAVALEVRSRLFNDEDWRSVVSSMKDRIPEDLRDGFTRDVVRFAKEEIETNKKWMEDGQYFYDRAREGGLFTADRVDPKTGNLVLVEESPADGVTRFYQVGKDGQLTGYSFAGKQGPEMVRMGITAKGGTRATPEAGPGAAALYGAMDEAGVKPSAVTTPLGGVAQKGYDAGGRIGNEPAAKAPLFRNETGELAQSLDQLRRSEIPGDLPQLDRGLAQGDRSPQVAAVARELSSGLDDVFARLESPTRARPRGQATASFMGLGQAGEFSATAKKWAQAAARAAKGAVDPRALIRSTEDLFVKLGDPPTKAQWASGESVAKLYRTYVDRMEPMRGGWNTRYRSILDSLTPEERKAFTAVAEGRAQSASPNLTAKAAEFKQLTDEIKAAAEANGRFVPDGGVAQYFPHYFDDPIGFEEATRTSAKKYWDDAEIRPEMEKLGATGPDTSEAMTFAAIEDAKRRGTLPAQVTGEKNPHLEIKRQAQQTGYITEPEIFYRYVDAAAKSIAKAEVFDDAVGDARRRFGRLQDIEAQWGIPGNFADTAESRRLFDVLHRELGEVPGKGAADVDVGKLTENIQGAMQTAAWLKLWTSWISQLYSLSSEASSQFGLRNTLKEVFGEGLDVAKQGKWRTEAHNLASSSGSLSPGERAEFRNPQGAGQGALQKRDLGAVGTLGRALTEEGSWLRRPHLEAMQQIDVKGRVVVDRMVRKQLGDLQSRYKAGDRRVDALLSGAGIEPSELLSISPQALAESKRLQAPKSQADKEAVDVVVRRLVDQAMGTTRPMDMPPVMSTVGGRAATQFMSFPVRQARNTFTIAAKDPRYLIKYAVYASILGMGPSALKAIKSGSGVLGEQRNDDRPLAERATDWRQWQEATGSKPIRVEDTVTALQRLVQTYLQSGAKPVPLMILDRLGKTDYVRDKFDWNQVSPVLGTTGDAIRLAGTLPQTVVGDEESKKIARRSAGASAARLLNPGGFGYEIAREIGQTEFGSPLKPSYKPGWIGRSSDLQQGKITGNQFLKGGILGGEENLSDERKLSKVRAELKRLQAEAKGSPFEAEAKKLEKAMKELQPDTTQFDLMAAKMQLLEAKMSRRANQ